MVPLTSRSAAFALLALLAASASASRKKLCTSSCSSILTEAARETEVCQETCKDCLVAEKRNIKTCEARCKAIDNKKEKKKCKALCSSDNICTQAAKGIEPEEPPKPTRSLTVPEVLAINSFRTINGEGNNVHNPHWGAADHILIRKQFADYDNGLDTMPGLTRPSARAVSNLLCSQEGVTKRSSIGITDMFWTWGQFLDHDISLTEGAEPEEKMYIDVPVGDKFFDPESTGTARIETKRSIYQPSAEGVREQMNQITAYIDASNVYGSDPARSKALRDGAKLQTGIKNLLPLNVDGFPNAMSTSAHFFFAGDVRANEQVTLTALHTVFMREHNRIIKEFKSIQLPGTSTDLYEYARAIVGAEVQAITYNEFLPILLGPDALGPYNGYDVTVNAGIMNEFSTAAYRVGHTLVSSTLLKVPSKASDAKPHGFPVRDAFFNPSELVKNGIDDLLRGLSTQVAQEFDTHIVDDLRNFLFGRPGSGGFDLASLNVQRGRDHGLPSYNSARTAWGLPPVTSWDQVTEDKFMQENLAKAYPNINDADLWVCGLAEDPVRGALVGPTFWRIIRDQFRRLRDGDRFFYKNLPRTLVKYVEERSLRDIIVDNSGVSADEMPDVSMQQQSPSK
eukprot:m.34542 g.34542  ORF g.34542 m.34542 type:complete len:623 (-) comp10778_c0_seq1:322-2190(-)